MPSECASCKQLSQCSCEGILQVVVFSAVRTGALGFLADTRRLNVMLTRARRALVIPSPGTFSTLMAQKAGAG